MTAVLALSDNDVFGVDGQLPWRLPRDLRFFRAMTWGCSVVMGRRTWDTIPARFRPLPGRKNMVLTRTHEMDGVETLGDMDEVPSNVVWIGGKSVLEQAFRARKIHTIVLTRVHATIDEPGAVKVCLPLTREVFRSRVFPADDKNAHAMHFEVRSVIGV